jgi:hypothetical protein
MSTLMWSHSQVSQRKCDNHGPCIDIQHLHQSGAKHDETSTPLSSTKSAAMLLSCF